MRLLSRIVLASVLVGVWTLTGCTIVGAESEDAARSRIESIRQSVVKNTKKLAACYDYELQKNPQTPEGKVVMAWDVDQEGHPQNILRDDTASTVKIETLTQCLTDEIREMNFPTPAKGDILHIKFPFVFKHDGFK